MQRGCVLSKFRDGGNRVFYKRVLIFLCRKLGYQFFHKRLESLVQKESARVVTHGGCLMWPVYGAREVLPMEVFENTVEIEFEGEKFPAPIGYDTYLRSLYGDYEKDPPVEKQKSHHRFTAYRL